MDDTADQTESQMSPAMLFLRKVRDVMGSAESSQIRLDQLVTVIAEAFSSQVCSIYLMRAGDVLELFASEGLNPDAVHLTRLHVGEGLVGEVARTGEVLNLDSAETHPKFAYRPETGEEKYHGFVAVPITRADVVVGVLVVQSHDSKHYSIEQVELLQTVSMVLAEHVGSGELIDTVEIKKAGSKGMVSLHLTGTKLAPGLSQARAVLHRPRIEIPSLVSESPTKEKERFRIALEALQSSIDTLVNEHAYGDETQREIFEAYHMFAHDKGWVDRIVAAIDMGLTAEAAVQKVQEQLHERMNQVSSQYLRERGRDLEEISTRLLQHLSGKDIAARKRGLPQEFVVVARDIGAVELLEYGRKRVKGLILEEGSPTSHIIIIARAMDIPVVGRIKQAMELVQDGDRVVVDGDHGEIYIRPTHDVEQSINEHIALGKERAALYERLRNEPSVTKDGVRISLNINAGLFVDAKRVQEMDVDGIGLYRTELPYMLSSHFPEVDSQRKTYGKVLRQAAGKKVVFRTFDVGGDKPLPYFRIADEENPAMGWRATRIGLDRPAILRRQCRALIGAASGRRLDVMFPFITELSEFEEAKALFDREMLRAASFGQKLPSEVRVGAMIEVPSILWQIPELAKQADFLSIGSNDLLQFLYASDRGNPHMSDRYDVLSPVTLKIFRDLVKQCKEAGTELTFCGELARKPLEAMALIGVGLRSLSFSASSIGAIKAMVRTLDTRSLTEYMDYLCSLPNQSVRERLLHFARDHGVSIK